MPVFHYALPLYLEHELERVQKRALSIICAGLDYKEALNVTGIPTIISYNEGISNSTFTLIITDKEHLSIYYTYFVQSSLASDKLSHHL